MMTESELVVAIRNRISDPRLRTGMGSPPIFTPAKSAAIDEAERELGFPIPPLLRRLYQEVGNGGFGPGYGLWGLAGGYTDEDGETLTSFYTKLILAAPGGWPHGILVICDLGCGTWLCIDGSALSDQILISDELGITRTEVTLSSLLQAWTKGADCYSELFEPGEERAGINPFTGKPRIFKTRGRPKGGVLIKTFPR
jgi:hypothetical protein